MIMKYYIKKNELYANFNINFNINYNNEILKKPNYIQILI